MIKLSDYQTQGALPAEMKTPERAALAYAFDRQKKKYIDRIKCVHIWADLEKVDDGKLDFLAAECRVLFYNTNFEPDIKRQMIQNSIYWHMKLGTFQAMKEIADILFGNENTIIAQWFDYGGIPYHFKIILDISNPQLKVNIARIITMIKQYKRAAARLDGIICSLNSRAVLKTTGFGKMSSQIKVFAYRPMQIAVNTAVYSVLVLYKSDRLIIRPKVQ